MSEKGQNFMLFIGWSKLEQRRQKQAYCALAAFLIN